MSFFVMFLKAIPYLWPFVKEMLIGKRTWRQAFRENRGKTLLAMVVIVSLVFNLVLMVKVGNLAFGYLELSRAKQELELKLHTLDKLKCGVEGSAKHPMDGNTEIVTDVKKEIKPPSVVKHPAVTKPEDILAAEVKSDMDRIRKREAAEH